MTLINRILPFTGWFKDYGWGPFKIDLVAGLTVALVLIPQSMAYAQLAGLPAHYGLYASFLPPMIAAIPRIPPRGESAGSDNLPESPPPMTLMLSSRLCPPRARVKAIKLAFPDVPAMYCGSNTSPPLPMLLMIVPPPACFILA